MPDADNQRVTCPSCGKGYRWQDALAGKVVPCKRCDARFEVPDAPGAGLPIEPLVNEENIYDLATDEDGRTGADPQPVAAPAVGGKCPNCNSKVAEHAVLCLNCGFNMREGKKLARAEVTELDSKERKATEKAVAAPLHGMMLVRAGLWLNLLSILAVMALIPLPIALFFFDPDLIDIAIGVLAYVSLGLGFVGSVLCLAAPKESGGRPVLLASIALSLISTIGVVLIDTGNLSESLTILFDLLSSVGTACFLYFFVMLARFLDFPEITERAEKVFGLYLMLIVGSYLLLITCLACILSLLFIGAAIYTVVLYILLLIDLNNALSYRIREQG